MRTGVFVQVRLGSTRLPAKALLPLPGGSVIQHVMRALAPVAADVHALLTDPASTAKLAPVAEGEGFLLFTGSPEDVLGRFCAASREYGVDRVVRATGDNPLTCPRLASQILSIHAERRADLSHFLGCPWGTGVEVVESRALFDAERAAADPAEREHITTFHYRHPDRFAIVEEQAPAEAHLPDARVTVDTPEDYERVSRIFQDLYEGSPIGAEAIVRWFGGAGARGASTGGGAA